LNVALLANGRFLRRGGLLCAFDAEDAVEVVEFVHDALELGEVGGFDGDGDDDAAAGFDGVEADHVDVFISDDVGDVTHEADAVPAFDADLGGVVGAGDGAPLDVDEALGFLGVNDVMTI